MKAKASASKRTKNRAREHPTLVRDMERTTTRIDGNQHGFFRCGTHCDWVGWLPLDELENPEGD